MRLAVGQAAFRIFLFKPNVDVVVFLPKPQFVFRKDNIRRRKHDFPRGGVAFYIREYSFVRREPVYEFDFFENFFGIFAPYIKAYKIIEQILFRQSIRKVEKRFKIRIFRNVYE